MLTQLRVRAADASPFKRRVFELFRGLAERAEGCKSRRQEAVAAGPPRTARWASSWSMGRCATSWACGGRAGSTPAARRSVRTPSASSARSGSTSSRYRARPSSSGLASLQPDGAGRSRHGRPADSGHRDPHRRGRRGADPLAGVFKGYYKQPDATRETMTADGWFRTGDSGFVDRRGHLVIIDRAKDVGKLADGTPFAPQFVENKLKFSPFIARGGGVRRPAAVRGGNVAIDLTTVGNWAERRNLAYTSLHGPEPQAGGAAPDRRARSPRSTRPCRRLRGSAASCC